MGPGEGQNLRRDPELQNSLPKENRGHSGRIFVALGSGSHVDGDQVRDRI